MRVFALFVLILSLVNCMPGRISYTYPPDEKPSIRGQMLYILPLVENPGLQQDLKEVIQKSLHYTVKHEWVYPKLDEDDLSTYEDIQQFREDYIPTHPLLLTLAIIKAEKVPERKQYQPARFNHKLIYYAPNRIPEVYQQGYVDNQFQYFCEVNLYDNQKDELIWNGRSENFDPLTIKKVLSGFSGSLSDYLSR